MQLKVSFKVNSAIYLRDPESSDLGRKIVTTGIVLIQDLGFEHFTFKKLAQEINTTEASIYRYFENKHRLLLYILNWYWSYLEYLLDFRLQNIVDTKLRLTTVIGLLTEKLQDLDADDGYNLDILNSIVITESSKVYLVKEVSEINRAEVFQPYKDLCGRIAIVISEFDPAYKFPRSLSSTLIEASHQQQFFSRNLPRLTDDQHHKGHSFVAAFLHDLVFKVLHNK
jgi:AcrR family transcriptional regulator